MNDASSNQCEQTIYTLYDADISYYLFVKIIDNFAFGDSCPYTCNSICLIFLVVVQLSQRILCKYENEKRTWCPILC